MKIKYNDDCLVSDEKQYYNYKAFANMFGLELDEEFWLREHGEYSHMIECKITKYRLLRKIDGKWQRACNLAEAMMSGAYRFDK